MRLVRRANDEINETNPRESPNGKIFTLPTALAKAQWFKMYLKSKISYVHHIFLGEVLKKYSFL